MNGQRGGNTKCPACRRFSHLPGCPLSGVVALEWEGTPPDQRAGGAMNGNSTLRGVKERAAEIAQGEGLLTDAVLDEIERNAVVNYPRGGYAQRSAREIAMIAEIRMHREQAAARLRADSAAEHHMLCERTGPFRLWGEWTCHVECPVGGVGLLRTEPVYGGTARCGLRLDKPGAERERIAACPECKGAGKFSHSEPSGCGYTIPCPRCNPGGDL